MGIKTIDLKGIKNDYIVIKYAEDNTLYVPVENIYVLEKYLGSEDYVPKLTKLGTKEWEKKKAKIKEKLEDIARKLIETQAKRELLKGFSYKSFPEQEKEFAEDFPYDETKDQVKAINDISEDMESDHPVDRLICGDVGFGKTEVAMRATFKAVLNGKQVAYLAPTTVLSRQHYYTFKERFEKYGMRVELLNRFVDERIQNNTIKGLRDGYVDIIIGTHRILSRDIRFKDLGILIIDEEHRFGVEHKERIKEMKANVDVLSLSATPIPRTLQMSLMGMRDLSLLETAPVNRYPVQTYVLEQNDAVVREAINRELGRGGQVFFLHNRISSLDQMELKIRKLVPAAKIATIHGQLDKEEIEDVMAAFLDGEYNVLLCTTIIETGIDIPNCNTIIINDAHRLGLAQIYQIRGRVGRSDRIAYAYLMYDNKNVLTEASRKRLESIKEFTALGSGYKIAMRDLSIRGAGDILGREQSGFIDAIGIDLYMKMLKQAINEQKGIKPEEDKEKKFDIGVSKHIDDRYVSDDMIKIEIHQKINRVTSREVQNDLISEFTDRYGKLSDEVRLYIEERYLEHLLKAKGVESFKESQNEVVFNFDPVKTKQISGQKLFTEATKLSPKISFEYRHGRIFLKLMKNDFSPSYIYILTKLLEKM
jgi:transcription-repair coupling factor (superfamily II helicase)